MTVEHEVSVKNTLSLVIHGLADHSEPGEGVDVTVGTHHANQLGWQGSSSSLDGHCVLGRGGRCSEEGETCRGRRLFITVSSGRRQGDGGLTDSDSEGCRPQR